MFVCPVQHLHSCMILIQLQIISEAGTSGVGISLVGVGKDIKFGGRLFVTYDMFKIDTPRLHLPDSSYGVPHV